MKFSELTLGQKATLHYNGKQNIKYQVSGVVSYDKGGQLWLDTGTGNPVAHQIGSRFDYLWRVELN